jgi:hypothetical protein
MNEKNQSCAFPVRNKLQFGLTKREYFAAIALQGLLANQGKTLGLEHAAAVAVNYADALIEELIK